MMNDIFCRHHPSGHSDDARRVSDTTRLAWTVYGWDGFVKHWMAFSLRDGSSDNVVYPDKLDAMRHTSNEYHHMFLVMHPTGMSICEAEIMLSVHRNARRGGIAMPSLDLPDGGPDLIPRIGYDKVHNQIRALKGGNLVGNRYCDRSR
jgi:hypothetical protein